MDQNRTSGTRCPDWGCCCDHGRECCADAVENGGNHDHLGERGGRDARRLLEVALGHAPVMGKQLHEDVLLAVAPAPVHVEVVAKVAELAKNLQLGTWP